MNGCEKKPRLLTPKEAAKLIDAGVDVVTMQTALGHSTAATTLNIYSHAFGNAQTRAMEAIASAINL